MAAIKQNKDIEAIRKLVDKRPEMFFWAMVAAFAWFFATPLIARLDREVGYIEKQPKQRFLSTLRLLWNILQQGVDSKALKRMNQTHARSSMSTEQYPDEFLMVVAVFVCEGIRFSNNFSSSPVSLEEQVLWFNFWINDVGAAMDIHDVPQSIEELEKWLMGYKEKRIIESGDENTHVLGKILFDLFHNQEVLSAPELHAPAWLPQDGELAPIVLSVMDEKVLKALGATPMIDTEIQEVQEGLRRRSAVAA